MSLGLGLRALEASIPEDQHTVREQVDNLVNGMADLYTELQELSRGIHPAILSKGGLGPAIKTLARRSVVPVRLELDVDRRLPESIEVAAYYVIAEALTNAAKHAEASEVTVRAGFDGDELRLEVADDGIGGRRPAAAPASSVSRTGWRRCPARSTSPARRGREPGRRANPGAAERHGDSRRSAGRLPVSCYPWC